MAGRHRAHRRAPRRACRRAPLAAALGLAGLLGGAGAVEESGVSPRPSLSAPLPSARPDEATSRVLAARGWVARDHPARTDMSRTGPVGLPANRLSIPSLDVEAPIDSAHAVAGSLALPADASRVARYDASPPLAAVAGTTIVAGHVTNLPQIGALFPLATVHRGALVYTTDDAGRQRAWQVVSVDAPRKTALPASLFTAAGPRRLAIITCGGSPTVGRDGARHYPRNVVVLATPAGGP